MGGCKDMHLEQLPLSKLRGKTHKRKTEQRIEEAIKVFSRSSQFIWFVCMSSTGVWKWELFKISETSFWRCDTCSDALLELPFCSHLQEGLTDILWFKKKTTTHKQSCWWWFIGHARGGCGNYASISKFSSFSCSECFSLFLDGSLGEGIREHRCLKGNKKLRV